MTDVLELPNAASPSPTPAPDAPRDGLPRRLLDRVLAARLESWITFAVVAAVSGYTLLMLHPLLLVADTTPAGGDMGAHVWAPAYLRDHLLPQGRLSGWAPDWYAGFPAYNFYMLPPALAIVLLDVVLPYGVAMKLVSVLGVVTMPISAWAMGRLAGLKAPVPALFAVATGFFLFDPTFTIYGGNIASTLAGEFSFSIALSVALLYIGVMANGLRTGRHRAWAAGLLALAALCHLIVAFFAAAATVFLYLAYAARLRWWHLAVLAACGVGLGALLHVLPFAVDVALMTAIAAVVLYRADPGRFRYCLTFVPVAALLSAFWMLPFWWRRMFMTDMGYERLFTFADLVFPQSFRVDVLLVVLAAVGFVGSAVRGRAFGVFLGITAVGYGIWIRFQPQGHLWNARLTPFLYLTRYLLVAIGVAELGVLVARWIGRTNGTTYRRVMLAVPVAGLAVFLVVVGMQLRNLPFGEVQTRTSTDAAGAQQTQWVYRWGPFEAHKEGFVRGWARWNYSGYERKAAYGEYYAITQTMKRLGDERGCGRANWEYVSTQDRYGTPMALMLLPFWTDGCIGSMEGLYFEASATTPYHFLTSSATSEKPSRPVRGLRYDNLDLARGVPYMQTLGVRYYMAFSRPAVDQATNDPRLTLVAESGPWKVFEVEGWDLVVPLTNEPAVVPDVWNVKTEWLKVGTSWFQNVADRDVMVAGQGPESWQRLTPEQVQSGVRAERRPLPPVTVSDVEQTRSSVSFRVDRPGVPVLVKVSYFPNWRVSGGEGPYRVAPNLMLVVPTGTEVRLTYGREPVEVLAYALSLLGVVGLVLLWRSGPMVLEERAVRRPRPPRNPSAEAFPVWSDGDDDLLPDPPPDPSPEPPPHVEVEPVLTPAPPAPPPAPPPA